MVHPSNIALPVTPTNCVNGDNRMNRVSVSDLRNRRCSGKVRSIAEWAFANMDRVKGLSQSPLSTSELQASAQTCDRSVNLLGKVRQPC